MCLRINRHKLIFQHYLTTSYRGLRVRIPLEAWPYILHLEKHEKEKEKRHQKDENKKEKRKGDKLEGKLQNDKEAAMGKEENEN